MLMLAGGFAYFGMCDLLFRMCNRARRRRPVVTYGPGSTRAWKVEG